MNLLMRTIAAVSSGLLLWAGFPLHGHAILVWIGLAPLLLAMEGRGPGFSFLLSYLSGMIFFVGIFNWILEVPGYTYLHHAILGVYLSSYFGLFGLAFGLISRRAGRTTALFAAPFLWVSLEYIRSNLSFLALPWGLLAHSQYQHPLITQIASLSGAYGLSFLIVLVNSAITAITYAFMRRLGKDRSPHTDVEGLRGEKWVVITAALFLGFSSLYGYFKTSEPIEGKEIKISLVQGNIEQDKKWDRKYAKFIMQTYGDLTRKVSKDKPTMIVWPEAATPRAINRDPHLLNEVKNLAQSAGTYLLLGSSQLQKFKVGEPKSAKYLNSAFLIPPKAGKKKNQRYDKVRLFPFGEYLPYKETIPWAAINVPDVGGFLPGKRFFVFKHPDFRFGVTICWENIFPDLVRQFVKAGAQVVINITNEAWFGKTASPEQFVSMSVFRAVENRLFVVRCTNTGISCFIDPCGRVVNRLKDKQGRDVFVRGILTAPVVPMESRTIFTRYGDWLAWLCFPGSAVFLFIAFLKRKSKRSISRASGRSPVND